MQWRRPSVRWNRCRWKASVETAFVTGIMSEKEYHAAADQFDTILNMIRIDV